MKDWEMTVGPWEVGDRIERVTVEFHGEVAEAIEQAAQVVPAPRQAVVAELVVEALRARNLLKP